MTTIQIKHRYTNAVLFEFDTPDGLESGLHVRHALEKAVASRADLQYASLDGANLRNASLDGANLRNASLDGASLVGANLRNASLDGASLYGASLDGASLDEASLVGASLYEASLDGANLRNASLDGANLRNASLDGANLSDGEKLIGKRPVFSVGLIGSRQDTLMAFTTDQGLRLKTGCFFGSLEKFRAALIAAHDTNAHREEYEAALLLIEKHAALWPGEQQ